MLFMDYIDNVRKQDMMISVNLRWDDNKIWIRMHAASFRTGLCGCRAGGDPATWKKLYLSQNNCAESGSYGLKRVDTCVAAEYNIIN